MDFREPPGSRDSPALWGLPGLWEVLDRPAMRDPLETLVNLGLLGRREAVAPRARPAPMGQLGRRVQQALKARLERKGRRGLEELRAPTHWQVQRECRGWPDSRGVRELRASPVRRVCGGLPASVARWGPLGQLEPRDRAGRQGGPGRRGLPGLRERREIWAGQGSRGRRGRVGRLGLQGVLVGAGIFSSEN